MHIEWDRSKIRNPELISYSEIYGTRSVKRLCEKKPKTSVPFFNGFAFVL